MLHQGDGFRYSVDAIAASASAMAKRAIPPCWTAGETRSCCRSPNVRGVGLPAARHARLVSAGPNGVIDTDPDVLLPTDRGDDVVLFLWMADP
jgi:hypothetical protein